METNTFMMHIGGRSILRSTGEEVEIIDSDIRYRGERSDEDWVTYIDSQGKEHIKEHLNIQLDFKAIVNDTFNKVFDFATNKMPTTRNSGIFEVAKELYLNGNRGYGIKEAVEVATNLVDTGNVIGDTGSEDDLPRVIFCVNTPSSATFNHIRIYNNTSIRSDGVIAKNDPSNPTLNPHLTDTTHWIDVKTDWEAPV